MSSMRTVATTLSVLGVASGATLVYALYVEPRRFSLRPLTLCLPRLPEALGGLTVLHVSDLHLHAGEREKIAMLRRLSQVEADLVMLTGDFTDEDEDIELCLASLRGLRGRYGTFAVLGNHDLARYRGSRWRVWEEAKDNYIVRPGLSHLVERLRESGIDLLRNESRCVHVHGLPLWVVGVDDPHQEWDDLARAWAGVPAGATTILLAHSPEILARLDGSRPDLMLSGHTHGGQVVLPLVGALVTRSAIPLEKPSGVFAREGTIVHISPGLGGSIRLRFNRPPEAELLTLLPGSTGRMKSVTEAPERQISSTIAR